MGLRRVRSLSAYNTLILQPLEDGRPASRAGSSSTPLAHGAAKSASRCPSRRPTALPQLASGEQFDAAHVYVCHANERHGRGLPHGTLSTTFEVVVNMKVYLVEGKVLQRWIAKRRQELKGPKGMLFARRPTPE